ncbi:MAG: methylated-DNA--[protein]-cysteine S-methyltransferase [Cohaesibacteraceae bacterium]|nr:methylated-DNA--[protein]-cysteine S-methyltransferase [Cohaesibacteraceae bacterium]MBL4875044.1 methylated-DNA--[protein]-cysteine S-methyltransferase [Cohaesibacteraceae bacterium]
MSEIPTRFRYYDSPLGSLLLAGRDDALTHMFFPRENSAVEPDTNWVSDNGCFPDVISQLGAYFAGELQEFDVPLELNGTLFQKTVWKTLLTIPFGEAWSYGDVAHTLGNAGASRAVGLANNANPIPIIVPCHRVIGADRSLVGFGGGLDAKIWLLRHENIRFRGDEGINQLDLPL